MSHTPPLLVTPGSQAEVDAAPGPRCLPLSPFCSGHSTLPSSPSPLLGLQRFTGSRATPTPSLCLLGRTITPLISSHKSLAPVLSSFLELSLTPCHLSISCGGQRSRRTREGPPLFCHGQCVQTGFLSPSFLTLYPALTARFPNHITCLFPSPREFWAP